LLRTAAFVAVVVVAAGCGSVERAGGPAPTQVERHLVYEKLVGEKGIWIADVDGNNPRLLVPEGHSPTISPDGRSVAYTGGCGAEHGCFGTYVVSTSRGKPRCISSCDMSGRSITWMWSPDSTRVLMTRGSRSADVDELVSIDVSAAESSVLASGSFAGASWSPDGKQVVFAKATPTTENSSEPAFNLFVVDGSGGKPKQITEGGDSVEPLWGPKSIAYSKVVSGADGWSKNEIWRVQPDGSGRKTISGPLRGHLRAEGFDGLVPVAWSDDGRALLAGLMTEYGAEPVAVDPDGGSPELLPGTEGLGTAGLSHDGRYVLAYYEPPFGSLHEEDTKVVILPSAGGKPTFVMRGAWLPSWNR